MVLDTHIHIHAGPVESASFAEGLSGAGIRGAVLLSLSPASCGIWPGPRGTSARLDNLFEWVQGQPSLIPFYWIDPTEADAVKQVAQAVDRGVKGFKIMCNHFYPRDARAMGTYRAIGEAGRPVLFHSGILWDGTDSSRFNRPGEFEALLEVPHLRFALAHISWPWVDECLAVYGKFQAAFRSRPELSCEMFIDTTPGTPPIYRQEALTKLFTIGYKVENNVLFGTDINTEHCAFNYAKSWIDRDRAIYDSLGLDDSAKEKIFSGNLKRFLG